jgi:hypothetical protein
MEPPFARCELSRFAPFWSYSYAAFLETLVEDCSVGTPWGRNGVKTDPH